MSHRRKSCSSDPGSGEIKRRCLLPTAFDRGGQTDAEQNSGFFLGTDIGRALQEAYQALDKSDRQKVLVLLTHGEDLEKSGVKIAEELGKKGVVIYTLGIGTPAGAELQFTDEQGRTQVVRDNRGETVRSHLDETALRAIAEATHGAYYPMGPLGEGLAKVRLALQNLSGNSGSTPERKLGVDRFHVPVAAVLVLLVSESLIGTRRRERSHGSLSQTSK